MDGQLQAYATLPLG